MIEYYKSRVKGSFIIHATKREYINRYKESMLGPLWSILQPLVLILIYLIVFSEVFKAKIPDVANSYGYGIFLCSGLILWNLFSEIILRGSLVFVEHADLLKKVQFNILSLPIIITLTALVNFFISFSIFIIFLIVAGVFPVDAVLYSFLVIALTTIFALSLSLIFGVLNVYFRDISHLVPILLNFWFWLTPIIYPMSIVPERFRWLIELNPLTQLFTSFSSIFVANASPSLNFIAIWLLSCALLLLVGIRFLAKKSIYMLDEL